MSHISEGQFETNPLDQNSNHDESKDQPKLNLSRGTSKRSCNCRNSKCIKLYCDCYANGTFCNGCNCSDCFNMPGNLVKIQVI